jgi:hypothetical protein
MSRVGRAAAVVLMCVVVSGCGGLDPAVKESLVWTAERPGGAAFNDEELSAGMVGERVLDEGIVATAACHSLLGHAGDWGVRPHLVVSSRLDLVRVAELAAGGEFDRSVVEAIEAVMFVGAVQVNDVAGLAEESGIGRDVVTEYLRERSLPPGEAALARFAVYVGNTKLRVQRLVVVDRSLVADGDFAGMPSQYRRVPFRIAGSIDEYEYTRDDCERLL